MSSWREGEGISEREAAMMLEGDLEYTEVRCGEDSIEADHELLEDSDLKSGQEDDHDRERLLAALKQAQEIFTLQTGNNSNTVKEIDLKINCLS